MSNTKISKDLLRKELLQKRKALTELDVQFLSEKIKTQFKDLMKEPSMRYVKSIGFFMPIQKEPDLTGLVSHFMKKGIACAFPKTKEEISFYKIESPDFSHFVPGKYGILEPLAKQELFLSCPDLVVVPGLAFSRKFHRIGYGKGYYDRYLSSLQNTSNRKPVTVGVCYGFQLLEDFEIFPEDVSLDFILTESEKLNS